MRVKSLLTMSRMNRLTAFALALALALYASTPMTTAQVVSPAQAPEREAQQPPASTVSEQARRVGVDESRPLALTLFDAVKMALGNNHELEVERINVRQSEYDLFAARGATDIGVGASTYYEQRTIPVGSLLQGGANGTLTTKTLNYDFTAQQLLPTGGSWLAQFTNSRGDTNSQFVSLNPQYNTTLNVQIRQPILRSFSIDD
ncbi:MAG TPA: hypothetical protein VF762_13665, partial [Blastocatellia bacterium]